ncbi:MAG TPA: Tat pathway signal sequence domain protein [Caulobacteraceae bacterium]|nr:Tat pathway signal sequence domain protein [Caulobacteraceae bacterium]
MRDPFLIGALVAMLALPAAPAFAQYGSPGGQGQGSQGSSEDEAAKAKRDEEWNTTKRLDLPGKKNAGPCPYVKTLWDASRYVELQDNREAYDAVGFTGEVQDLHSGCEYTGANPIHVEMELLFAFGRGPQARGSSKEYTYWVAVTDRNYAVLDKQYFTIRANFPSGQDRVLVTDHVDGITIPRADRNVSGSNFEILVGFDVTPEMAAFNQAGKRFRVNAGDAPAVTAQAQPSGQ